MQPETPTDPYFILAPLKNWNGGEFDVVPKLMTIRHLKEGGKPDLTASSKFFSGRDIEQLDDVSHWLWYDGNHAFPLDRNTHQGDIDLVEHAQYSAQILAPVGGKNVFLTCRSIQGRITVERSNHRQELQETTWSRLSGVPDAVTHELPLILPRLHEAFGQKTIRIMNAVQLLEHGLQATNLHIRTLYGRRDLMP
jgi:hypothetical protein